MPNLDKLTGVMVEKGKPHHRVFYCVFFCKNEWKKQFYSPGSQ